jgi:hypothetical protein
MPQLTSTTTKAIVLAADVSHYVGVSLDVLWTLGQDFLHFMLTEVKPQFHTCDCCKGFKRFWLGTFLV